MNHVEFEKKLMEMLLKGDDLVLKSLRNQYIHSIIISREFTGAGFFTKYKTQSNIPPLANTKTFQIGDIRADIEGIEDAIGFILFVKNGYLLMLEGYTLVSNVWPKEYSNVILYYNGPNGSRDFNKLKAKWS